MGNLILAAQVWVVNDAPKQTCRAITPNLFLPISQYRSTLALNLGEHRRSVAMQARGEQGQRHGPELVSVGRELKMGNGFKEGARLNLRLLEVF